MVDSSILAAAVFLVFAANVFLFYRWKGLKDELEEKHNTKKLSSLHKTAVSARSEAPKESGNARIEKARETRAELQSVSEGFDELYDQMHSFHSKLAA